MKKFTITESEKKGILNLYGIIKEDTSAIIKDALKSNFKNIIFNTSNELLKHPNLNNISFDISKKEPIGDSFFINLRIIGKLYGGKVNNLFAANPPYTLGLDCGMSCDLQIKASLTWNGYKLGELVSIDPKTTDTYSFLPNNFNFSLSSLIYFEVKDTVGKIPSYIFKPTISNARLSISKIKIPYTTWTFFITNSVINITFGTVFGIELPSFDYDLNPIINKALQKKNITTYIEIPVSDVEKAKLGKLGTPNFQKYIKQASS
jgi:hypothetical protein